MSYTYKGTKVTGTSEGGALTTGVKKNDTYLNTQTGHVYVCTEAYSNWAKWKYVRTDLIGKPDQGVYGLASPPIGNGDRCFTATWSQYDWSKNDKNGRRMTNQYRRWQVNTWVSGKPYPLKVEGKVGRDGTQSLLYLTNFKVGNTTYNRASFYPLTKRVVTSVSCTIWTWNEKGYGPKIVASRNLQTPRKPSISVPTFNAENGHLSFTISTDAGADYYERYDTRYKMTVVNTRVSNKATVIYDTSSTSTEFTTAYDATDYMQMSYDDYIKVTVEAWARGLRGDSGHVSRTYYISYPAQASITGTDISSEDSTGKCTVRIKTNSKTEHPVDRVKLEYLANVEYASANSIPGDAGWSDTDIIDDGECTALSVAVTNLIPEKGKYTWLRIKTWHAAEGRLYRYSTYKSVLHKPASTAQDDEITIISAVPAQDGKSIAVQLAWNADGNDDSTGTELSWSNELDTWKSTKDPDKYEFTWSDGRYPATGTLQYNDSALITIKGLQEGEKYYIKARRYLEGDVTSYSPYSDYAQCITSEIPEAIVATCDKFIAKGSPLPVYWTFSGNGVQTRWQIVMTSDKYIRTLDAVYYEKTTDTAITTGKTYYTKSEQGEYTAVSNPSASALSTYYEKHGVVSGKTYYTRSGSSGAYSYTQVTSPVDSGLSDYYEKTTGTILASGEGSTGFAQIPSERIDEFAENNTLSFNVQASTGSDYVISENKTVTITEAPTLTTTVGATLTAQPFSFTAAASTPCRLLVIVASEGASGQFPTGKLTQTAGDTIHSDIYEPEWTTIQSGVSTTITLPNGLDFWNLGNYELSVTAIDDSTGLSSETIKRSFSVAWSHNAVPPISVYVQTTDSQIDSTKTYYTRTGSGTEADPYVYEIVDEPSAGDLSNYYEEQAYVKLTTIDETDDTGKHRKAVQIDLTAPEGTVSTDVYDIYRLSGDGAQLIGEGFPLEYTTADEYAPFGEDLTLYYRVAVRTSDGAVDYSDFEYNATGNYLRLDWDSYSLELPFNISVTDNYKKSVEIRQHMDGNSDGYWNQNIERSGSLSTDVIRLVQPNEISLAKQLARYPGVVFVRTPIGDAYEADVQVTELAATHKNITSIAIDASEVGLTQEFMLPVPETEEEEEEEEEE